MSTNRSEDPLISIITVCYNCKDQLESTIISVIGQTYKNIEFILIDGGSTDGTNYIISKYREYIDVIISEKDEGIYDAMNKGINVSKGVLINYMNAGDMFYSESVIAEIIKYADDYEAVLYGRHEVRYENGNKKIIDCKNISTYWKGMFYCHQSSFVPRKLLLKNKILAQIF